MLNVHRVCASVGADGARLVALYGALVHVRGDGVHARAPAAQLPRVLVGPRALLLFPVPLSVSSCSLYWFTIISFHFDLATRAKSCLYLMHLLLETSINTRKFMYTDM